MRQDMTMDEIMEYQGRLYYMPLKKIRERSEELLDFCGLWIIGNERLESCLAEERKLWYAVPY